MAHLVVPPEPFYRKYRIGDEEERPDVVARLGRNVYRVWRIENGERTGVSTAITSSI